MMNPDPAEWLSLVRLQKLEQDLLNARSTLAVSGLLTTAINSWVRQQLAHELSITSDGFLDALAKRELAWRAKHDIASLGLLEDEVSFKLSVAPNCLGWAENAWGTKLETLFLQRKGQLDKASCRLLRVTSKGLSLEIYHRIKANEANFELLAQQYGEGPERLQGGLIPLQPLSAMPMGLDKVLPRLKPGELLPPRRLGTHFAIVMLESFVPARFDDSSCRELLEAELNQWLKVVVDLALKHLMCSDSVPPVIP